MRRRFLNRAIPLIAVPGLALAALLLTFLLLSRSAVSATPDGEDTVPKIRVQEGPFTVSGTIVCRATGPISDVEVYARTEGEDTVVLSDTTDSGGVYSLALEGGSYDLNFEPPAAAGLNARAFTIVRLITDTVLDVDFCVCSGVWVTEVVDSAGNVGRYTSLALAPTYPYTPHVSYSNLITVGDFDLKYAWRSGATWQSVTVDQRGGEWTSLALVQTYPHTPCISYHDQWVDWGLKYACQNGITWTILIVDVRKRAGQAGTSLALEPTYPYTPHVSYNMPWNIQTLYHSYLSGTTWMSGTWVHERVEHINSQTGWWSSLALEPTYPYTSHIGYYDRSNGDLKHAWKSGTIWLTETVDSAGNIGWYTSLALDSKGNPHISYWDNTNDTNNALKYAWLSGTTWLSRTVDHTGRLPGGGGATSLALDHADEPYISYYDANDDDLKLARFDGKVWIIQTVDSEEDVGQYSSLELDPAGCPHISYYDATNGDLNYAYIAARLYGIYLPLVLRQFP